jgi:hypothetical protein
VPILGLFGPQKPYQEVYPEPTVESTEDDEIPVNVADTGEGVPALESVSASERLPFIAGIRHGG